MASRSLKIIARAGVPGAWFLTGMLIAGLGMLADIARARAEAQVVPEIARMWNEVTLYRDEWGVPHVYADHPRALGFGLGYAEAEDHAEPIQFAYRMVRGRLAAVLGEAYAQSDAFALRMGHATLAAAALNQVDEVTRELCEGFALGFNAWLADNATQVPAWYDGVRPEDPLALWHAFLTSFAPMDLPLPYRTPPAMETANAWALAPSRVKEGNPVLVFSPHQHYDGPFQWTEVHLVMGDMDVYGAALRGVPVVVMGITPFHGWALTPNFADTADAFDEFAGLEQAAVRNPKQVGGEQPPDPATLRSALTLDYMARTVPYYVLKSDGMEERGTPSYIGARGPVFDSNGTLVSWLIGGYFDFGGIRQLVEMARARSLDAFRSALVTRQLPCFHVVYTDATGTLFYLYNAVGGTRAIPTELLEGPNASRIALPWNRIIPGFAADWGWREGIPIEALPACVNPEAGFLQACNTTPWSVTDQGAPKPGLLPPWFVQDRDSFRGARVAGLLRQGPYSFAEARALLFDTYAGGAVDPTRALLAAADAQQQRVAGAHPDLGEALALLKKWNHVASPYSPEMTFFHLWWSLLKNRVRDVIPGEDALRAALRAGNPATVEAALGAAEQAAQTLRNEFGQLKVPWGDVHVLQRGQRKASIGGSLSGEPVLTFSDTRYGNGKWQATYGMGFALAAIFGTRVEAVSLVPFGSSDVPGSPHYDDQLNLLLEQRFKTVRLYPEDVLTRASDARGCRVALMPRGVTGMVIVEAQVPISARLVVSPTPEELPPGTSAFTPAIRVIRSPDGIPFRTWIRLEVPSSLCRDGDPSSLGLFAREADGPWLPLDRDPSDPPGVFTATHDSPAACYAILGPSAIALPREATETGKIPPSESVGAKGIDLLLPRGGPAGTRAATGRVFRMERLDREKSTEPQATSPGEKSSATDAEPERETGTFRFEFHAKPSEKGEERPVMPEVPGYRYGPGLKNPFTPSPAEDTTGKRGIFHIERLDQPELPGAQPPAPVKTPEPESVPAQPDNASSQSGSFPSTPTAPSGDRAAPQEAASEPEPKVSPPDTSPSPSPETRGGGGRIMRIVPEKPPVKAKEEKKNRPRLPDVIPQDPNFVFTPGSR